LRRADHSSKDKMQIFLVLKLVVHKVTTVKYLRNLMFFKLKLMVILREEHIVL
jgi:hypothetical protein